MSESYLIELITEEAKRTIEGQIEHLKTMASEDEYRKEFSAMLQGAKTVIWVLENESIGQQGTRAFLNHLDRGQLDYAIKEAERIKKQKTDIGKVELFGVFGGNNGAEWFWEKDKAKEAYILAATESLDKPYPEISFDTRKVPAEELEDYLKEYEIKEVLKLLTK